MITIKIKTDNAAFQDDDNLGFEHETARILRELADKIESCKMPKSLMDINGNVVGEVKYTGNSK